MNKPEQKAAAEKFAERWKGHGYEKGETQKFWLDLLANIFGIQNATSYVLFEEQVKSFIQGKTVTQFIDAYIPETRVMIEQKSSGKSLTEKIKQSDGTFLTPFEQAKKYIAGFPLSQHPKWIITCNFDEFLVYDMENPNAQPEQILLKDFGQDFYRLEFLVSEKVKSAGREVEVSLKAGELVGKLYDALLEQYIDPDENSLRSLNVLCVRIVFCLYAEDAGLFETRTSFEDYIREFSPENLRKALQDLFCALDTEIPNRDKYETRLKPFPYVNGGLFRGGEIEIPNFTAEIIKVLADDCASFDWSEISPTIFGAVFESTLNAETRRNGGMHYTSIENIHKVIDPLFMDSLEAEFKQILQTTGEKSRTEKLLAFQTKLAELRFFDPACGSGNFLTETYTSLRRLENRILKELFGKQVVLGDVFNPVKVSIQNFYGIEINDFAVTVARTALWIAESQTLAETSSIVSHTMDFLPLKTSANIVEGNSLRIDWHNLLATLPSSLYIIGNPPFVGARMMSESQKQDMLHVFGSKWKNLGNIDYVGAWYKKAADLMSGTGIRTALVSTNSISQGEQVANLWQPLFDQGVHIDFAHRTFRWDSEASQKAHVHCVIIGFSCDSRPLCPSSSPLCPQSGNSPQDRGSDFDPKSATTRTIFDNGQAIPARNINAYLMDAPNVFVGSRSKPLCPVPEIGIGNKPIDGGFYLFTYDEMLEFIKSEPKAEPYFHPWYGAQEFIHQSPRYCLWLGDCSPKEIASMPHCKERVQKVREYRLASPSAGTRKIADKPTRFHVENMPKGDSIIVPKVSSERRDYVPMGFISEGTFASDLVFLIPNATLFHFGVLESCVHMAWMRAVCGRLKSDYRYSKDVVYNNFPWPSSSGSERISQTAQAILDARALYPDSSLADLYDPVLMPSELRKAHRDNDRAVLQAYGFSPNLSEQETVAELFKLYQKLSEEAS